MVDTAQALVELTKNYLMEIQSNEDWSMKSGEYISMQSKLVEEFQSVNINSLHKEDKEQVQGLLRTCYQLEMQINNEVSRQYDIVSDQISQFRKGNNFRNKYEMSSLGSGLMLDTYK
ncbi:hypothetical protein [Paenibacillus sp. CR_12]|uniref:hypothetical protein n=1 Tax=Paenibacillus sp. CR_12 TaxID=3055793 RepID=UPI0035C17661